MIKDKAKIWILAARPKTLPAAAAPVIVGSAFAFSDGSFKLLPAVAALAAALLLQIGANLANDVFDYHRGADNAERLGPKRVTQAGLLTSKDVLIGMWVVFGLAALLGIYLFIHAGWPIIMIGVMAILAAIAYTGGPIPLGYYGLGDLTVFIFFGLVAVAGTYYVQVNHLTSPVIWASIPVGLLITAILVVNNLRDINTDAQTGKKTLAVRIGIEGTRYEFFICLFIAYIIPGVMWWMGMITTWVVLIVISIPMGISLIRSIWRESGSVLNRVLEGTGRLVLIYSLLFSLGVVIPVLLS